MSTPPPLECIEIEEGARILRVELDDGFQLLPYMSFRGGDGAHSGKSLERSCRLELRFDQGILTLHGKHLDDLISDLQCERILALRKGLGSGESNIEITKLSFFPTHPDGQTRAAPQL